jgi:hypothetical protein
MHQRRRDDVVSLTELPVNVNHQTRHLTGIGLFSLGPPQAAATAIPVRFLS